jgi:signal transduction histidine kinase
MKRSQKTRTLRHLVTLSWVVPAIFAFLASGLVFGLLAYVDYRADQDAVIQNLFKSCEMVSRRVAAEVLLGSNGRVSEVLENLRGELKLEKAWLSESRPNCQTVSQNRTCVVTNGRRVVVFHQMNHVDLPMWVGVQSSARHLSDFFNWTIFAWSAVPVFAAFGLGLYFQQRLITKFVTTPIYSLVNLAESKGEIPADWPSEMQTIAKSLGDSFQAREDAVFAMLARGVIHDIKTWIHSLMTATELANEAESLPAEQRHARLEKLLKASNTQLPKVRTTIERALESGRDLDVSPNSSNLAQTIEHSLDALEAVASEKGVMIKRLASWGNQQLEHDAEHLERAISNVLKNAIEAASISDNKSKDHPTVSVSTAIWPRNVEICIEDSGKGISVSPQELLKPTRSTKKDGSGLGLYLANKIVRSHRGAILIGKSESLGGAKFTISIPKSSTSLGGAPC